MAEPIITKTCRICKETKPLSNFYRAKANKDGYQGCCKDCRLKYTQTERYKAYQKHYSQTKKGKEARRKANRRCAISEQGKIVTKCYENSEKCKIYRKQYQQSKQGKLMKTHYLNTKKGKTTNALYAKHYRLQHPEYCQAHNAVRQAIVDGKLESLAKLRCLYCPNPAKHYHHHKGYKPEYQLEVIPICKGCHINYHINYRPRVFCHSL